MDSNSAKYRVSLAVKNSWAPWTSIERFDFITTKHTQITLNVLGEARDAAGLKGEIIGYILIEKGTGKKAPAPVDK